jgi:SAM-dependent methyltransferase
MLSIARQTLYLNAETAIELVNRELGQQVRISPELELDRQTRGADGSPFITDSSFYSLFTAAQYNCLDVTDYEGANIIADLCNPLAPELAGRFDFIINGSCLDNIFDPAMALRNLTRLLKPGGRIIHMERASRAHNVYVAFALSWFHDYYAINDFDDCQVYLAQWDNLLEGRWDIYRYSPVSEDDQVISYFGEDRYYFPHRHAHAIVIAEKGLASTSDKSPIQFGYRPGLTAEELGGRGLLATGQPAIVPLNPYFRAALRFFQSSRPSIVTEADKVPLPDHLFHYDPRIPYCGSIQPLT